MLQSVISKQKTTKSTWLIEITKKNQTTEGLQRALLLLKSYSFDENNKKNDGCVLYLLNLISYLKWEKKSQITINTASIKQVLLL